MHDQHRYKAAKRATVVNASTNSLLSLAKIILGLVGNSHALLADGIHSLSDLFTDALVFFAAKISAQHPDKEHPYGHRRVETVSAIIIALVLTGVAIGIGVDAFEHILSPETKTKPEFLVVIVAIASVLANEFLFHYTLYEGNKANSDLLRTNAWHNRSDALVSLIVLVSVIGAIFGAPYLDAIGALIIAILILGMAVKMIWKSVKELIDTAVEEKKIRKITTFIQTLPGVVSLHQLRTRLHGENIFLDVHVQVSPRISISEGHYISEEVIVNLKKEFPEIVDVTVHIDPENDEEFNLSKGLPNRKVVEALLKEKWQALPHFTEIQKTILHYLNGKLIVELYFPITLHQQISQANYPRAVDSIPFVSEVNLYYR